MIILLLYFDRTLAYLLDPCSTPTVDNAHPWMSVPIHGWCHHRWIPSMDKSTVGGPPSMDEPRYPWMNTPPSIDNTWCFRENLLKSMQSIKEIYLNKCKINAVYKLQIYKALCILRSSIPPTTTSLIYVFIAWFVD